MQYTLFFKINKVKADITYVRKPKERFIYLALLMDVFTRMIRAWHLSRQLNPSLTLKPLEDALRQSVPEIHHSDQGVQYLSKAYLSVLKAHDIQISIARRKKRHLFVDASVDIREQVFNPSILFRV